MRGCELSTIPVASGDFSWQTSSFCDSGACVGVACQDEQVLVRNTSVPEAPVARFTRQEWKAFIAGVKTGEFDGFAS